MDERLSGDWPDIRLLVTAEAGAYLATAVAVDPALPTRCPPWTVRDVTRHLAATFERYAAMLRQARAGDLSPPFAVDDLDAENLRAVREFTGDPEARLRAAVDDFVALGSDPGELLAHQRGPLPVGLQLAWGLKDLAVHHADVAVAAGGSYTPSDDVVSVLETTYRRLGWWEDDRPPGWSGFVSDRGS